MRLIAQTKAETALLEPFQGLPLECIHLPKNVEEIERASREIAMSGLAGFDTESRAAALVQGDSFLGSSTIARALMCRCAGNGRDV